MSAKTEAEKLRALAEFTAYNAVIKERDTLKAEVERLKYENAELLEMNGHVSATLLTQVKEERDQLRTENKKLHERYRAIELANKELSRNDHVVFGNLLSERNKLIDDLAVYEKALESIANYAGEYVRIISEEALAKVKGGLK